MGDLHLLYAERFLCIQNSGCWQVWLYPAFRQIELTRKAYSVCVVQYSSGKVSQLSCIHKILHLSFKQNGGVHVTCWKWWHIGCCTVGSCMDVAVCDLNGHWWSDRRNLVGVPLWKLHRSSPICLRDWPPPAVLGVERLPGVVETLSTLVCLDSSHSRRYFYHSRCLCANYQPTGCLVLPSLCLVLLSWVLLVCFLKGCYKSLWCCYRYPSWISSDSNASQLALQKLYGQWGRDSLGPNIQPHYNSSKRDKDPSTKTMHWRKGRCWSPDYEGYLYRS